MFLVEKKEPLLQNNHTTFSSFIGSSDYSVLVSSLPQQSQYWSGVFKHFRSINTTRTCLKKRGYFWIVWLERKLGNLRWSKEKIWETSWNSVLPESNPLTNQSRHPHPVDLHQSRQARRWLYVNHEAGGEFSPEPNHLGTLILGFQSPELWENRFLSFKPSSLWHFIW